MEHFEVVHVYFLGTTLFVYISYKDQTIKVTFRLAHPEKVWKMTDFLIVESIKPNNSPYHVFKAMEMEEKGTWDSFRREIFSLENDILNHKQIRIKRLFMK